jgi:Amt family ammonium transporter
MIDQGNTAWLLVSAALVLLMTPGVAFFYSGLVNSRNALNTINMSFICLAIIPILWAICGFSLVFAPHNAFIGGLQWLGLIGVGDSVYQPGNVPQYVFMSFQMMFAVITPALISGAIVGRMKFKPYVLFITLWSLFVYIPIAHWVWGPNGWLASMGALDFAGGTVVHMNAGFAALVAAIILGPRVQRQSNVSEAPHNVPLVVLGVSLLWFGWYGFNAGSAISAGQIAGLSFVTTTLATAASIITWTILVWLRGHLSSVVSQATAAVVGLVAITPAAGFVTPLGAIGIGCLASIFCYIAMASRHAWLSKVDDTLDVFICHGLSGLAGAVLTGVFATKAVNAAGANGLLHGNPVQLWHQLVAVMVTIATTMIGTAAILFILKLFMHIRPTPEEEQLGIDAAEHGETAYDVEAGPHD